MQVFGVSLRDISLVLIVIIWFALSRWVFPRLGVPT